MKAKREENIPVLSGRLVDGQNVQEMRSIRNLRYTTVVQEIPILASQAIKISKFSMQLIKSRQFLTTK